MCNVVKLVDLAVYVTTPTTHVISSIVALIMIQFIVTTLHACRVTFVIGMAICTGQARTLSNLRLIIIHRATYTQTMSIW